MIMNLYADDNNVQSHSYLAIWDVESDVTAALQCYLSWSQASLQCILVACYHFWAVTMQGLLLLWFWNGKIDNVRQYPLLLLAGSLVTAYTIDAPCPVCSIMSCSSTPAWNSLVAVVARREWFVLCPVIPAALHIVFIMLLRVLCPRGTAVN